MKKVLIGSLLVLLTICLFVACSSCPEENGATGSVTFDLMNYDGVFYFRIDNGAKSAPAKASQAYTLYKDKACKEKASIPGEDQFTITFYVKNGEPDQYYIDSEMALSEYKDMDENCEISKVGEDVYLSVLKAQTIEFEVRENETITVEFYDAVEIYVEEVIED